MQLSGYGWALIAFCIFFLLLSTYLRRYIKTLEDYYVMGWRATWPLVAGTTAATVISAVTFLANPGLAATWGWGAWYPGWFGVYAGVLLIGCSIGVFFRRLKCITLVDFFARRYGNDKAVTAGVVLTMTVGMIFYLAAQFIGGGWLLSQYLGIPREVAILAFAVLMLICVILGGMWSVVLSDFISISVMVCAMVLLLPLTVSIVGGFQAGIASSIAARPLAWTALGASGKDYTWVVGNILSWFAIFSASPHILSRALIAKTEKDIYKGFALGLFLMNLMVIFLFIAFTMLGGYYFIPELVMREKIATDAIPLVAMARLFPFAFGILYVLGIFNATWSTANTQLAVTSQFGGRDLYGRYINPKASERRIISYTMIFALIYAFISIWLAISWPGTIAFLCLFIGVIFSCGLLPAIILSCFAKLSTKAAALLIWIGLPISLFMSITYQIWNWFYPHPAFYGPFIGFGLGGLLYALIKPTARDLQLYAEFKQATARSAEPETFTMKDKVEVIIILIASIALIAGAFSITLPYLPP